MDTLAEHDLRDLKGSRFCGMFLTAYRFKSARKVVRAVLRRLEPDPFISKTLRHLQHRFHEVYVGAYSYGSCLRLGYYPPNVTVGRYVSSAGDVSIFRRNHPMDRLSLHPYFYNSSLGSLEHDNLVQAPLVLGHDCWIGDGAKITASCARIGIGAVVGTGAVVTKDVPDFAVVVGVPAKIVKFRFDEQMQTQIIESKWWEKSKQECVEQMEWMIQAATPNHPFLSRKLK
jgi:virginiamycin A acetyltransferase